MMKLWCVVLIFFLENIERINGIRCYDCKSKSNRACGDDFTLTSSNTSYIVDNCDVCNKYIFDHTKDIVRNCTSSKGFQFKTGCEEKKDCGNRVEVCSCSKDLCNGSRSEYDAILIKMLICFSVYSLYRLVAFNLHLN